MHIIMKFLIKILIAFGLYGMVSDEWKKYFEEDTTAVQEESTTE